MAADIARKLYGSYVDPGEFPHALQVEIAIRERQSADATLRRPMRDRDVERVASDLLKIAPY